ncbi:hypothetical protein LJC10_02635 [Selenomonadales bacterium OttesenSCG-928-I06]|nr:hypothetical protein [Selenomonadales bacterium OttesenSCG-928-I06]
MQTSIFASCLIFFLIGGLATFLSYKSERLAHFFAIFCAFAGSVLGVVSSLGVLLKTSKISLYLWSIVESFPLVLAMDNLSAYFVLVISLIGIAVTIYSIGYVGEYQGRKNIAWLSGLMNIFMLSMIAVVTSTSVFSFLLSWELMSLVSFLLVMYDHEKKEVRSAGYIYVVMTHLGTVFLTLSFLTLFLYTGSLSFSDFTALGSAIPQTTKDIIFVMSIIGFGTKAGILPLHVWLPRAHPAAPSNISALMSAVMLKTAIYGLFRMSFDFLGGGPVWWGVLLIVIGLASAFIGIVLALAENDMKRFLAYSSSENMGLIFVILGTALIFKAEGQIFLGALAVTALLFHVMSHALFKSLLFMSAGSVLYATHTKDINLLGGLIKKMPKTAILFLIGGMSMASLPPLSGFISEWAILQSLLHVSFDLSSAWLKVMGCLAVAILALVGAFALAALIKQFGTAFLAMPRSKLAEEAKEVPLAMQLGMAFVGVFIIVFGFMPQAVLALTSPLSKQYFLTEIKSNMLFYIPFVGGEGISVGIATFAFIVIILIALAAITWYFGKSRYVIDETWNCGTPLNDLMEYNGTSYSHSVMVVFKKIIGLESKVQVKQKYEYYPKQIKANIEVDIGLEDKIYKPMIDLAVTLSQKIKMIQSGNLQSYLAYMVCALIIALLFLE